MKKERTVSTIETYHVCDLCDKEIIPNMGNSLRVPDGEEEYFVHFGEPYCAHAALLKLIKEKSKNNGKTKN